MTLDYAFNVIHILSLATHLYFAMLIKLCFIPWQTCPVGHIVWRWCSQPTVKYGILAGDFMLATNILLSGSNYANVALLFSFMNMGMVDHTSFYNIQDTYCVDTIKECWEEKRAESIERLQTRDVVIVGNVKFLKKIYILRFSGLLKFECEVH